MATENKQVRRVTRCFNDYCNVFCFFAKHHPGLTEMALALFSLTVVALTKKGRRATAVSYLSTR